MRQMVFVPNLSLLGGGGGTSEMTVLKCQKHLKIKNFTFLDAASSLVVIYAASIAVGIIFLGIYGAVTIHAIHLQNLDHKTCNL